MMALDETNHVIPVMLTSSDLNHWTQLLNRAIPDAGDLPRKKQSAKRFNMCPTIYGRYGGVHYPNPKWGYAVNTLWQMPDTANEFQSWDAIRHPSTYPWFMDHAIYYKSGIAMAYNNVPNEADSDKGWGVGFHHVNETRANVAFADGVVRLVSPDAINSKAWFENR